MNKETFPVCLYSERLILKTLESNYAENVLKYFINNKDFFKPWLPEFTNDYFSIGYHRLKLNIEHKGLLNRGNIRFWLFDKMFPDKIIGDLSYSNIIYGCFLSCHLGYKMDKDNLRKGYCYEALKLANSFIFDNVGLHRIEANIIPRNTPSINLIEKLGFVNEGMSPKYLKINGVWEDHIHYVLLNDKV